jgi:hypothetical protein
MLFQEALEVINSKVLDAISLASGGFELETVFFKELHKWHPFLFELETLLNVLLFCFFLLGFRSVLSLIVGIILGGNLLIGFLLFHLRS